MVRSIFGALTFDAYCVRDNTFGNFERFVLRRLEFTSPLLTRVHRHYHSEEDCYREDRYLNEARHSEGRRDLDQYE